MMKLLSGLVRNWSNGFVALSQVQDDGIHAGIKFHMEIFLKIFWDGQNDIQRWAVTARFPLY